MKKSKLFLILFPVFLVLSIFLILNDIPVLGIPCIMMVPGSLILALVFFIRERRKKKDASAQVPIQNSIPSPVLEPVYEPNIEPTPEPISGIYLHKLSVKDDNVIKKMSDYYVLDLETTGFSASVDRIVEISILKVEGNQIVNEYHTYVNPERPIPAQASAVNHVYDNMVQDAPKYADIRQPVADILLGSTVIGHNVTFDLRFINELISPLGLSGQIDYFDTCSYARRVYPTLIDHKLQTLLAYLEIDPGQAHSAGSDTRATFELFNRTRADRVAQMKEATKIRRELKQREDLARRESFSASPMLEKRFVFCGDFKAGYGELEAMVKTVGALPKTSVSSLTDYLVIGSHSSDLHPYDAHKMSEAQRQQEAGRPIKIISEEEFYSLIESARSALQG